MIDAHFNLCIIPPLIRVQEASKKPLSNWEKDDDSSEDEVPETVKEHKRQFTEWRKKHYNEFHAVKRAKELMKQVCYNTNITINFTSIIG